MASNYAITPQAGTSCALAAAAVTPSDTVDLLNNSARGLYIGAAGNVKVDMVGGGTVTFIAPVVGEILQVQARRVYSTGTTATTIIALY